MKARFITITLLSAALCIPHAQAAEKKGNWFLNDGANAPAGITGNYISTPSLSDVKGADASNKIELGYSCKGEFFLYSKDLGFAMNQLKCGPYGCKKHQLGQIKFDDKANSDATYELWLESNGMFLLSDKTMLTDAMKAGSKAHMEVEMANTGGKKQMATFSLKGFTASYNWCAK